MLAYLYFFLTWNQKINQKKAKVLKQKDLILVKKSQYNPFERLICNYVKNLNNAWRI